MAPGVRLQNGTRERETNTNGCGIKRPEYLDVEGLLVPSTFTTENVLDAIHYKAKPDDVFISTYPKCGTTWMQYIVTLIFRQGKPFAEASEFFRLTPFMEMAGRRAVDNMPRPGAFKTHLPYHLTPQSPDAKYIYVARNPKDCCVSLYHHTKMFPGYKFQTGTFEEFFDAFMEGQIEYGDYFDHLLGWYEHRDDPNLYFVTYENLKSDPRTGIKGIARFLDKKYFEVLENNPEILEDVLRYSSFDHMKNETNDFWTSFLNPSKNNANDSVPEGVLKAMKSHEAAGKVEKANFVRKGIVGDYKTLFTEEQVNRLEEKFREKAQGTDAVNLFEQ